MARVERSEADVRRHVLAWVKRQPDVVHRRWHAGHGASAGWPDDEFILPAGVTLRVEFKRPGRKPEPLQEERLKTLRALGHPAAWFDNSTAAIAELERALAVARGSST